jgi:hypothetical protein
MGGNAMNRDQMPLVFKILLGLSAAMMGLNAIYQLNRPSDEEVEQRMEEELRGQEELRAIEQLDGFRKAEGK